MSGNVIKLTFKSPHVEDDMMAFLACITCRNKTFTLTDINPGVNFPLLKCAACGSHLGRMGWTHDDDPMLNGDKNVKGG